MVVNGISGWPKKSTARRIKQGVYGRTADTNAYTNTSRLRATAMTRGVDPTVVRASHGAIETNTSSSSNNIHLPVSADNDQLRASVGQLKRTVESQADNVNSLRKTVY